MSVGFTPSEVPVLVVAGDGTLAAVKEPNRIAVIEMSGGVAFAEIGTDPTATGVDVGWVGAPPRLLVVSRFASHAQVYLVDPHGPRTISEIRMEGALRLLATTGTFALLGSPNGAMVIAASEGGVTPYQFPSRQPPRAAGAAGGLFMVAVAGAVEEWDPAARMPRRRFRTPHAATITALGGSDRVLWMTTQAAPQRIEVIALVNRGQPKTHDLPEPIAAASGHPRSDLLVCLGATSRKLYVVDLDGRAPLRVLMPSGLERVDAVALSVGRSTGLLAVQVGLPVAIVGLDGRESSPEIAVPRAIAEPEDEDTEDEEPPVSTLIEPPPISKFAKPAGGFLARAVVPATRDDQETPVDKPSLGSRISGWRSRPGAKPPAPPIQLSATWHDDVVTWTRGGGAGAPPTSGEIEALALRFGLVAAHVPAIVIAYGAHLLGERGAAPAEVALALGGNWREALGTGELAARGVLQWQASRVGLADPIRALLDGLPPQTGALVGTPGAVAILGPCAVIGDGDLVELARTLIPRVAGAILVAHPGAEPGALAIEARARRAAPLVRAALVEVTRFAADEPVLLVVPDAAAADQLGIPQL